MNNTLLFIVIAIIIVAIGALFFLQKLQKNQGKLPRPTSIDKQPTIKMADPRLLSDEDIANALSAQQPPQSAPQTAPQNELAVVDTLIQNQDYQGAINELKRLLMTNPRHTGAMLKLLQVYGLTKQYTPFNQLHQKIHQIADAKTIQDADFFKSLIDEEIASTQPATPTPAPTAVQVDTIEFDTPPPQQPQAIKPTAAPQAQATDDEVIDLVDFGEPAYQTQPIIQPTTTPTHATAETDDLTDFGDLEFDFNPTNTPKQTPANADVSDDIMALDELTNDTLNPPNTHAQQNSDEGLDFDFDFGDSSPATPKTDPASADPADALAFDFDEPTSKGTDSTINTANTTQSTPADETDFGLSLDFGDDKTNHTNHATDTAINTSTPDADDGLDFGEFSFDISNDKKESNLANDSANAFDLSADFGKTDAAFDVADMGASDGDIGATDITDIKSTQTDKALDFAPVFDINDTAKTPTHQAETATKADDFDGIEFDFAPQPKAELSTQSTQEALDDLGLDLDLGGDLTFDGGLELDTSDLTATTADTDDFGMSIDFDVPQKTVETTPATDIKATVQNDFGADALKNELGADKISEDKKDGLNSDGFDWQIDPIADITAQAKPTPHTELQPVATVQEIPVVITATPATSLEASLSTPTDDSIQITLELAKQYVEFGEYEGAKRLLQEVVQDGLPAQKQEAHALMVTLA